MTPIDAQTALNVAGFVIAALGGWWLNNLDRRFRDSEKSSAKHEEKIQSLELLVAGQYITRIEHEKFITAMFKKLDGIALEVTEIKVQCAGATGCGK